MAVPVQVNLNPNARKVEAALARIKAQAKGINLGGGAESINKLSRPLGKITGQASEFQKSLEASNARVLAFGASVAVINKLSQAFGALVTNTIKVEASFAKINTILGGTQKQLEQFGNGIFKVAQQTGTSFDQVAEGALELARQGLSVEESLSRVSTALKLVRVSGIDAEKAVGGLTAAIKGFEGAGLTVAQIADKLAEVDTKFAVSTEDLINGLERASASARVAGVSFDELLGVVTTVQERTQRGGAVIGNAFKTIFARLSRTDTLVALQDLGISVLDAEGNLRGAIPLFQELAVELNKIGLKSVEAGEIIQKVAGVRQRDILISLIEDLNSGQSQFAKSLQVSAGAAGALDAKNSQLNQTLEALINNLTVGSQKLASVLGDLGFTDAAGDILKALSSIVNGITDILQGEGIGAKFAQGLVKGVGSVLTGPGLALISAIFIKLFVDLAKFGATSLKQILGINKAAAQQATLQQSVLQTLLQNENIQREILALEGNKVAQEQLLLKIYNQQAAALARVQRAAATVTPGLFGAGLRGGEGGVKPKGKASGGYIAAEARDVSRGVGGAPANSRVVSIPNFAFGGGKRGTMVANTSEYIVPNFAGGGDAIFNRDMVRSMGLPAGARKINAAGGFIPNFSRSSVGAGLSENNPYRYKSLSDLLKKDKTKLKDQDLKDYEAAVAAKSTKAPAFDAEKRGLVMLVPQTGVRGTEINTVFKKAQIGKSGKSYGSFLGKAYGIDPNLKGDPRFGNLVGLDDELEESMATAINTIIKKVYPSIKTNPAPDISPEYAKKKFLNEGGAGAFGAFKGAVFEAIIDMIVGGSKGDGAGRLDVAFNSKNSAALTEIFGLTKKYSFGDYKSSLESKDKFIKQAIANRGASGYIPNFAAGNYVFDSDKLDRKTANDILKTILGTKKKKDLLIAPAGTGKSTAAARLGQFIKSPSDVQKAKSFTILSGAGKAKNSLMSSGLSSIIEAVNASGGNVSYLYAKNMEILSRRMGRIQEGSDDLRSTKQLKGTLRAPLNQFDFIRGLKNVSKRFSIMRGAEGFMPELGDAISREVSAGVPLNQVRINQSGKLRNAQNPMGLAVTNTRDEPTGRIPNFALTAAESARRAGAPALDLTNMQGSIDETSASLDNSITKIFALQLAASGLTSAFTEQDSIMGRFGEAASTAINTMLVLSTIGVSPLGALGRKEGGGFVGLAPFIQGTKGLAKVFGILKGVAGPVALGFTALDVALKIFNGKGIFQIVGEGLGLVATEAQKAAKRIEEGTKNLGKGTEGKDVLENLQTRRANILTELQRRETALAAGTTVEKLDPNAVRGQTLFDALGVVGGRSDQTPERLLERYFGEGKIEAGYGKVNKISSEGIRNLVGNSVFSSVEEVQRAYEQQGSPITQESAKKIFSEQRKSFISFDRALGSAKAGGASDDVIEKIIEEFQIALASSLAEAVKVVDAEKLVQEGIKKNTIFSQTRAKGQIQGIGLRQSESIRAGLLADTKENRKKLATGGFGTELEKVNAEISIKERGNQAEIETKRVQLNQKIREQLIEQSKISGEISGITKEDFDNKVETFNIEKLAGKDRKQLLEEAAKLGFKSQESQENFVQIVQNGTTELANRKQELSDELDIEKSIAQTNAERADKEKSINEALKKSLRTMQKQAQLESIRKNAEKERLGLILNDPTAAFSDKYLREIKYNQELAEIEEARVQSAKKLKDLDTELAALVELQKNASEKDKKAAQELVDEKQAEVVLAKENNTELERTLDLREKIAKKIKDGTALEQSNAKRQRDLKNLEENVPDRLANRLEDSISSAMDNLATGTYDSLGDVFLNIALDFGRALQQEISAAVAKSLVQSFTSSSGGSGFMSGIGNFFSNFAKKNSGGLITGGSGVRDDVPAVLTGGEYVIKKSAVQKYGVGFLEKLNSGAMQGMQAGGFFVPGTRGQGAITGKENLLAFSQQETTSGLTDVISARGSGMRLDLETQSRRLTTRGRFMESPARRALKEAQQQAFGLYGAQIQEDKRVRELMEAQQKAREKAFKKAVIGSAINAAFSGFGAFLGGAGAAGTMGMTDLVPGGSGGYTPGGTFNPNFSNAMAAANGGQMSGQTNAMLMGGEYIVSPRAASAIGRNTLDDINMMRFQNGGPVSSAADSISKDEKAEKSANIGEFNITINIDNQGGGSVDAGSSDTQSRDFARRVKNVVVGVIEEEKRLSGSLFSSKR